MGGILVRKKTRKYERIMMKPVISHRTYIQPKGCIDIRSVWSFRGEEVDPRLEDLLSGEMCLVNPRMQDLIRVESIDDTKELIHTSMQLSFDMETAISASYNMDITLKIIKKSMKKLVTSLSKLKLLPHGAKRQDVEGWVYLSLLKFAGDWNDRGEHDLLKTPITYALEHGLGYNGLVFHTPEEKCNRIVLFRDYPDEKNYNICHRKTKSSVRIQVEESILLNSESSKRRDGGSGYLVTNGTNYRIIFL